MAQIPDRELLSELERSQLGRLFEAYGKKLIDDQRKEIWAHIADGAINSAGFVLIFVGAPFPVSAALATTGFAVFIRNRLAARAWKQRKKQLKFFEQWLSELP